MTYLKILFADNDPDFLQTWCEFLEKESYKVFPALDPTEAVNILMQGQVRLAIIDIRLLNDDDDADYSGLEIAKNVAPDIPKIILTRFPSVDAARRALGPRLDGLPPAVEFVAKQDGPQALLTAIRKTARLTGRFAQGLTDLSQQIKSDYEDARQQARLYFWGSFGVSILGMIIIFVGIGLVMANLLPVGLISTVAGIAAEMIAILFFKRTDVANGRMDEYHRELLETRRFENLLAAGDELLVEGQRQASREKIIEMAARYWLGQQPAGAQV